MKTMFSAIKENGRCDHPKSLFCMSKFFSLAPRSLNVMMSFSVDVRLLVRIQRYVYITPKISVCCLPSLSFKAQFWENVHDVINSSEGSDILVFNCYLWHVRFLLTCYVCSTKIGEISDISDCFDNFVSLTLGVLTRIYAAELRIPIAHMDLFPNALFTFSIFHLFTFSLLLG